MKRRSLVISIIVVFLVIVWAVGSGTFDRFRGPEYVRAAQIKDVAWGTDESLYMMVQWVVKERRSSQEIGSSVVEFDEDAVYRLDPDERVVRRLPMDEARRVIERWPGEKGTSWIEEDAKQPYGYDFRAGRFPVAEYRAHSGWVGGRYIVYTKEERDTKLHGYQDGNKDLPVVGVLPWRPVEHLLFDFRTGAVQPIEVSARIAPDDRYVVYQDTPAKNLRIRWLPDGKESTIPDSVIPKGSDIYPTTRGLLDPKRQVLIDPETWEATEGWRLTQHIERGLLSPDGRSNVARDSRGRYVILNYGPGNYSTRWNLPTESTYGNVPEDWQELEEYPDQYDLNVREWDTND